MMKIDRLKLLAGAFAVLTLAGCPLSSEYKIEVQNNTQNQPFSPLALITSSRPGYVFELAKPASTELEHIAESGNNQPLLEQSKSDFLNVEIVQSGNGLIKPGNDETVTLLRFNSSAKYLSLVSMLTNTNDGFIGEEVDLSKIDVGETRSINAIAWDAGTEQNTEAAPTLATAGFDPSRDDVNFIHTHPGIISNQDGLINSALTAQERFLSPVAKIIITRVK